LPDRGNQPARADSYLQDTAGHERLSNTVATTTLRPIASSHDGFYHAFRVIAADFAERGLGTY
jgi:hypothetical protein